MPTLTQDELARELTTKYVLGDQSSNGLMPSARILAEKYGVSRLFLAVVAVVDLMGSLAVVVHVVEEECTKVLTFVSK